MRSCNRLNTSREEDHQEAPDRLYTWAIQKWPALLLKAGLALFWLACLNSVRLPIEALFVGPAMMVAGVTMTVFNKRESRR
jgi:hypothetical protein